jgi:cysteine synthase
MNAGALMPHWFEENSLSTGQTPLIRLNWVADGARATAPAKTERRNPAFEGLIETKGLVA